MQDVVRFWASFITAELHQQFCSKMEKMGKQWKAEAADFIHQAISKNWFSNFAQKQSNFCLYVVLPNPH